MAWTDLKFIEPESKFIVNTVMKRNFDGFTDSAQKTTNWIVLGSNIGLFWFLVSII